MKIITTYGNNDINTQKTFRSNRRASVIMLTLMCLMFFETPLMKWGFSCSDSNLKLQKTPRPFVMLLLYYITLELQVVPAYRNALPTIQKKNPQNVLNELNMNL